MKLSKLRVFENGLLLGRRNKRASCFCASPPIVAVAVVVVVRMLVVIPMRDNKSTLTRRSEDALLVDEDLSELLRLDIVWV